MLSVIFFIVGVAFALISVILGLYVKLNTLVIVCIAVCAFTAFISLVFTIILICNKVKRHGKAPKEATDKHQREKAKELKQKRREKRERKAARFKPPKIKIKKEKHVKARKKVA